MRREPTGAPPVRTFEREDIRVGKGGPHPGPEGQGVAAGAGIFWNLPAAPPGFTPEYLSIPLPSFRADRERHGCRSERVIAVNFEKKITLSGGTAYAGEMKRGVFGLLNFIPPPQGIMPMHCSANIGPEGDTAIFFGLSGTGKTTLSADPNRTLIGADQHGWSDTAVFNFEGGCYAKMIRLSAEA